MKKNGRAFLFGEIYREQEIEMKENRDKTIELLHWKESLMQRNGSKIQNFTERSNLVMINLHMT